jgi:PBSX family phage terminase large subunit
VTTTLEHTYTPRGSALELFRRREREVLVSGPAGTGKSRACLEKLHVAALVNPGMRGLIVRKTATSLTNTALVTWREHVADQAILNGDVRWYGGSAQEAAGYHYTNGSVINVGGMDKPDKIMSSEYDLIYAQEATELTEDDWEKCTTRLRNGRISFAQIMADCNPSYPTHWLKERCNKGQTVELISTHTENPVYFNEDGTTTERGRQYMEILDNLTGVRKLRLQGGQWVAAEGSVFEGWIEKVHHIDRFDIPDSWPRDWVVDFGFTNPFVWQCWAEDPDGRLFMYREIYHTKRLVEDHARDILNIVAPEGKWIEPRPRRIICDHDAEDRETLRKHLGMANHPAKKDVSNGVQAVQSRLKVLGDGKARLYILKDSLVRKDPLLEQAKKPWCTYQEIPKYIWDPKKDAPVKEDDHGCDCIRYRVAEADLKGTGDIMRGWF